MQGNKFLIGNDLLSIEHISVKDKKITLIHNDKII
jgi:hypothetical protein